MIPKKLWEAEGEVRLMRYIDIFDKYRYFKNIDIRFFAYRKYRKFELDNLISFFSAIIVR